MLTFLLWWFLPERICEVWMHVRADKPTSKNKKKRDARKAKATADVSMLLKNQLTWGSVQKKAEIRKYMGPSNCFLTEMYRHS